MQNCILQYVVQRDAGIAAESLATGRKESVIARPKLHHLSWVTARLVRAVVPVLTPHPSGQQSIYLPIYLPIYLSWYIKG